MKTKKRTAKPKPQFRIEFEEGPYIQGLRWTWRIVAANGEIVLSSGSQLFSRRIDARRIALKLARAFKCGRVEMEKAK